MGSSTVFRSIPQCSEKELRQAFDGLLDSLRSEYGTNAYNGTFTTCSGLTVCRNVFAEDREARAWLEDTCQKWEDVLAVRVGTEEQTAPGGSGWHWLLGGCVSH